MSEEGSPNLDCMGVEDLQAFLEECRPSKIDATAIRLFPFCPPAEARNVVQTLEVYALLALQARDERRLGHIQRAIELEQDADLVYQRLPKWARW